MLDDFRRPVAPVDGNGPTRSFEQQLAPGAAEASAHDSRQSDLGLLDLDLDHVGGLATTRAHATVAVSWYPIVGPSGTSFALLRV